MSSACLCACAADRARHVRVGEGLPHHCGHLLDGGDALSAATLCLSLRGGARFPASRDLQGHGAAAPQGDHQPGHDRNVASRTVAGLDGRLAHGPLAASEGSAGSRALGPARPVRALGEGFCRRPEPAISEILSNNQRGTDDSNDWHRDFGGCEAVLAPPHGEIC